MRFVFYSRACCSFSNVFSFIRQGFVSDSGLCLTLKHLILTDIRQEYLDGGFVLIGFNWISYIIFVVVLQQEYLRERSDYAKKNYYRGTGVRFAIWAVIFFIFTVSRQTLESTQPPNQWLSRALFRR
jgi:hypothetical protein